MSGVTDERELPEEVADQLRAVARARTAGTTPWPRVHVAVRRSRRRRIAGVAAMTVALVVAGTLAGAALRTERTPQPAERGIEQAPVRPPDPDPLNFAGATAGSLGDDMAWIQGLKERIVGFRMARDVAHVRVLWATDHAGSRHAVTIAQPTPQTYRLAAWRGPEGAEPGQMSYGDIPLEMLERLSDSLAGAGMPLTGGRVPGEVFQIRDGTGNSGPGLLVAVGSDLSMVDAASGFDYDEAGNKTATWTPLTPDAAVWWRVASADELATMKVRIVGPDGKRVPAGGGYTYSDIKVPPIGLAEVAAPGTDPEVLACAAMAFSPERGGFPAGSTPLLGAAPQVGPDRIGLAVARAPGGGYLVGLCRTKNTTAGSSSGAEQAGGYVLPAPEGGFDDLFAVLPGRLTPDEIAAAYVVAPVGATEVEVAGATAPVRDRLAIVTLPPGTIDAGLRAEARDAAGNVLATAGLARYESLTEFGPFFDVRPFAPYAGDEPPE